MTCWCDCGRLDMRHKDLKGMCRPMSCECDLCYNLLDCQCKVLKSVVFNNRHCCENTNNHLSDVRSKIVRDEALLNCSGVYLKLDDNPFDIVSERVFALETSLSKLQEKMDEVVSLLEDIKYKL